ncbi:uncharacterized protein LOC111697002 isoform X2 [Eurytemora carolleeae]|uniref:uncharacterized protein LOC111697002 isoform X2 n=1 Tax=Eurytemora carolleeae TaxID=1294199 RepID=UPI000C788E88|nr:uncharacterized protein LOC111697002 isoform X2 [Eurytemora carolleeae]|eukprot:XP_023322635.1 uncharacterized protein LOC111697002 isoform X2 [Eurytemora affinis]
MSTERWGGKDDIHLARSRDDDLIAQLGRILQEREEMEEGRILERVCIGLEKLLACPRDLWSSLEEVINDGRSVKYEIRKCFEYTRNKKEVFTNKGKGRLFMRYLLQQNLLLSTLEYLALPKPILDLAEQADRMRWKINLENSCWLDVSWETGMMETHLLVPSADLGVFVTLASGKPIVTKVLPGSVAAEDGKIEIGDTLTHINGELVINQMNSGQGLNRIFNLLEESKGKPISITVTKAWNINSLELFSPVVPLLKQIRINVEDLQRSYFLTRRGIRRRSDDDEYNPLEDFDEQEYTDGPGYSCLYMGSVNLGTRGDVDQIEVGIQTVLNQTPTGVGHPAVLRLLELELVLSRPLTKDIVLKLSYPNISSCGRIIALPKYFAFIAQAKNEMCMCHVFYTSREETVSEILDSIGEGFSRTSFTV